MNKKMLIVLTLLMSMVFVSSAFAETVTLRPNGQGYRTGWTNVGCSSGSSEWQCVDEDPASTSDYLYATGTGKETFTFSNTGLSSQSINSVTMNYYAMQHNSASNSCFEAMTRSGGTDYLAGTQMCVGSNWSSVNQIYSTNPATGSAWTVSEVDALEAGMHGKNPNSGGRVAQVYAVVDYTPIITACNDGSDNDNDGLTDYPNDAGCSSSNDNSELGTAACDNGVDESNDADALADFRLSGGDQGCSSVTDTNERDGACDDLLDNDLDGTIDFTSVNFTADPECGSYADVEYECSDTDGGFTPLVQGTVSGSFGGTPFSQTDFCVDSTTLTEYYCNYNWASQNVNCALNTTTQCVNGACV